jgi:hypothetical protein
MSSQPKALRLVDVAFAARDARWHTQADDELRRLHVDAIEDAAELRRLSAENESLRQIVQDFPPVEAELREVSDRAHRLETQRDALLEVAKLALRMGQYGGVSPRTVEDADRAAIKAVEEQK